MSLFKKKGPHITQITSCSSGDFLFVFGLGSDGACYIWNSTQLEWLLHKAVDPNAAPQAK